MNDEGPKIPVSDVELAAILKSLERGCTRRQAYRAANVSRCSFYRAMKAEAFRAEIEAAEAEAIDDIEHSLWREAKKGNVTAMIFFLMNRRPERWQDRRNQFTPPKDDMAERQQAVKEAYDQLSEAAREALEEADRRKLEQDYQSSCA